MGTPYLSEIRIFSFNFAPRGWAPCNGQLLPINQNQALFALLGTTYGGDGRVNFALPNLQGCVAQSQGLGYNMGAFAGEENHTLTLSELPAHTHLAVADTTVGNNTTSNPQNGYPANTAGIPMYSNGSANLVTMSPSMVTSTGGGQPHANQQPFLVLNACIALQGIFPSQN